MQIENGQTLGLAILSALQIDPKGVTSISIECSASGAELFVTRVFPKGESAEVSSVLQSFELQPKSTVKLADPVESVSLDTLVRTTHRFAPDAVTCQGLVCDFADVTTIAQSEPQVLCLTKGCPSSSAEVQLLFASQLSESRQSLRGVDLPAR